MSNANKYITGLLGRLRIVDFDNSEPNRWIFHDSGEGDDAEEFTIEIYQSDGWVTFTSVIMINLQGGKLAQFYEALFRLNHYLNGFKLGVTTNGDYITLQTDMNIAHLDLVQLKNTLLQFRAFYSQYYSSIVEFAQELGLKFRKSTRKPSAADIMWNRLIKGRDSTALVKRTDR